MSKVDSVVAVTLFLVDAGVERVPPDMRGNPSVQSDAERKGREPGRILLDISRHYEAMRNEGPIEKRGRPDIAHMSLLTALDSPINQAGHLETYLHTVGGDVIWVSPDARLPRNLDRFEGLCVQLLEEGEISTDGKTLMRVEEEDLGDLVSRLTLDEKVGLSRRGPRGHLTDVGGEGESAIGVFVGSFQRGRFSDGVEALLDRLLSLSRYRLSSHVSVCIALYQLYAEEGQGGAQAM